MNSNNQFKPASKVAIDLLKSNGFEAFLIGGSVRDYIMGLPIGDIDITTNATPQQVKSVFCDFLQKNPRFFVNLTNFFRKTIENYLKIR